MRLAVMLQIDTSKKERDPEKELLHVQGSPEKLEKSGTERQKGWR